MIQCTIVFGFLALSQSIVEGPSLNVKTCPRILEDKDVNIGYVLTTKYQKLDKIR